MPDAAAFEGFYREHLARIVRACFLVTLDRQVAEDVAAEAFARLWSRWGVIVSEDHAGGFVFKTAMRLCTRELRGNRSGLAAAVGHRDQLDEAMVRRDVTDALARLPLRQRQAVVLGDWAGFGTREVARLLGTRESTVRVHLARGRAALRATLGERQVDDG